MLPDRQAACRTTTRLERQLLKLAAKPAPENVHHFRTYARRVEAVLNATAPELKRNEKKLLKLLGRLRKRAGKIRDLDVQIAALRNLKIPDDQERKSQLLRALSEERARRQARLAKSLNQEDVRELRKRLKRAPNAIPNDIDALALAARQLSALHPDNAAVTEQTLHQYRIAGKRARYLAELSKDPEAVRMVGVLKRMQDVIGDWHDWLKLSELAQKRFGQTHNSVLLSALRNVTQAKFRQAVHALAEARASLIVKKPASRTAARATVPQAGAAVA